MVRIGVRVGVRIGVRVGVRVRVREARKEGGWFDLKEFEERKGRGTPLED